MYTTEEQINKYFNYDTVGSHFVREARIRALGQNRQKFKSKYSLQYLEEMRRQDCGEEQEEMEVFEEEMDKIGPLEQEVATCVQMVQEKNLREEFKEEVEERPEIA